MRLTCGCSMRRSTARARTRAKSRRKICPPYDSSARLEFTVSSGRGGRGRGRELLAFFARARARAAVNTYGVMFAQLCCLQLISCECKHARKQPTTNFATSHTTVLPRARPKVSGLKQRYALGDRVELLCAGDYSRPVAALAWLINGELRVSRRQRAAQ